MTTLAPALQPVKVLVIEGVDPIRTFVKPLVWLSALSLLAWGGWTWAKRTPYFTLRQIEIAATPNVPEDVARGLMGLDQPVNAFDFDPGAARLRLLNDPWVLTAQVELKLPDRVMAQWTERRPVAVALMGGHLYYVDHTGRPFVQVEMEAAASLPLITGMTAERYDADPQGAQLRMQAAMALSEQYEGTAIARRRSLGNVHIGDGDALELMLGRTRVALGERGYARKLHRLEAIDEKLSARGVDAAYILMEVGDERAIVKEIPLSGDGV